MPDIILMGCSAEQTRVLGLGSLFLLGKLPVTERLALIAPDSRFQLATFLLHLQQMIALKSVNAGRQTDALQTRSGRLPLLSVQTGPTQIDKLLSGMTSRSGDVVCALCAAAYFVHGPSPCCSQRAVGYGWNLIGDFIPGFFTLLPSSITVCQRGSDGAGIAPRRVLRPGRGPTFPVYDYDSNKFGHSVLPLKQLNASENTCSRLNRASGLQAASIFPGIIKQERKMTSALPLFPRGANPARRDAAITYHNQKVLVW